MKYGLEDKIIERIIEVFARFPAVEEVILYGSRARGNFRSDSDIDLILKGESLTPDIMDDITHRLLALQLPCPFELYRYNEAKSPEMKEDIIKIGVSLYRKQ